MKRVTPVLLTVILFDTIMTPGMSHAFIQIVNYCAWTSAQFLHHIFIDVAF